MKRSRWWVLLIPAFAAVALLLLYRAYRQPQVYSLQGPESPAVHGTPDRSGAPMAGEPLLKQMPMSGAPAMGGVMGEGGASDGGPTLAALTASQPEHPLSRAVWQLAALVLPGQVDRRPPGGPWWAWGQRLFGRGRREPA